MTISFNTFDRRVSLEILLEIDTTCATQHEFGAN